MRVAMVGLGRMGMNMARRLLKGGHEVVAFNRTPARTEELAEEGAMAAYSLEEAVEKLAPPRIIWLMLPAGQVVEAHVNGLAKMLSAGDIVVDGGNTDYRDDIRRAEILDQKGIRFMDVGVSGGIWGLEKGYCLMAGGDRETYDSIEPLFKTLAPDKGYLYCGPVGAGHFVKMVHNGIEYGMMQAYGEGFEILEASPYAESMNYADVAGLWNRGSVIRSWLLELAEAAFSRDRRLDDIRGYIEDSGEGRWTVRQALDTGVSAPVIALSLMQRFSTQREDSFSNKVVAALRREFGGHAVAPSSKK
jgi:6-phosphogluconate dehydrogenase